MSDLFAFDEQAANPLLDEARANSVDSFDQLDSPAFRGTGRGLGMGIMRGGARTADFMQTLGSFWDEPGTDKEALDSFADQVRKDSIDYWTPAAHEVGGVGQVLGSLGEIVLPLAASGGHPALLMGSTAIESGKDLVSAGVDAPTAVGVGSLQALATGLGFRIPVLGSALTSRLATGAAGNVLFGLGARGAENVLLTERGYADKAPPILDMASLTTDVLTGLLFGGLHHTLAPRINPKLSPSEVDAVLTARNAKSFQTDTAPGTPEGTVSEVGHQDALQTALEQLSRSEPVNIGDIVAETPASFSSAEHVAESERLARQVEAGQPTDVPYEPDSVKSAPDEATGAYSVQEGELTDEQLRAFEGLRSDVPSDQNLGGPREGAPGESGAQNDGRTGEPLTVFRGSNQELVPQHFEPSALGHASGHPSSGLGVFFSQSREEAARYGAVAEHLLDIRNPKVVPVEDLPGFDTLAEANAYQQKLIAEGHDGIVIDASHLGGPVNYVAFKPEQVIMKAPARATPEAPVSTLSLDEVLKAQPETPSELPELAALQSLANERPTAAIYSGYDAEGQPIRTTVAEVADQIQHDYERDLNTAKAFQVAVQCFLGHGA